MISTGYGGKYVINSYIHKYQIRICKTFGEKLGQEIKNTLSNESSLSIVSVRLIWTGGSSESRIKDSLSDSGNCAVYSSSVCI